MQMYSAMRRRTRGFTLIELLVVIAIIAILAAILFPVFARARENARRASCQSNAKQILIGVMQYTQDNDERYPLTWTDGINITWSMAIQPYVKSSQVFSCPSDRHKTAQHWATPGGSFSGAEIFHNSYIANIRMGGYNSTNTIALSQVASPATTVYLTDGARGVDGDQAAIDADPTGLTWADNRDFAFFLCHPGTPNVASNCGTSGWSGAPSARHLETVNVGYADGHVKAQKMQSFYKAPYSCLDPATGCS